MSDRSRARKSERKQRGIPPAPSRVGDARFRLLFGSPTHRKAVRAESLANDHDVPYHQVYRAIEDLVALGHAPRDRRVVELARRRESDFQQAMKSRRKGGAQRKEDHDGQ